MTDTPHVTPLVPPVYPRQGTFRQLFGLIALSALTFSLMWFFR
jgi:hypothetical protein